MARQHVAEPVDIQVPEYVHSYSFSLPADAVARSLATLDLGYFTIADDPVGSDRAIRSIEVELDASAASQIFIGGPDGQAKTIQPGGSFGLSVGFLSSVFVRNDAGGAKTVRVLFVAMNR